MDIKTDIKIGDIVPLFVKPFGGQWVKCASVTYGVVIALTGKYNPRIFPIYYKTPQQFTSKDIWKWVRRKSVIMPDVFTLSEEQKEEYLRGGIRQSNYDNLMVLVHKQILKKQPVRRSTESYFTFD